MSKSPYELLVDEAYEAGHITGPEWCDRRLTLFLQYREGSWTEAARMRACALRLGIDLSPEEIAIVCDGPV